MFDIEGLKTSLAILEEHLKAPAFISTDGIVRMTGERWYACFEREISLYDFSMDEMNTILVAARKASGVEG